MNTDMACLLDAATFAAGKHETQRRKDVCQSPYINHPLQVAALLADVGSVEESTILIAAILHDTVEDTETSLEEISNRFGDVVGGLVAEVTDDRSLSKERRKQLQVETAAGKSDGAKQVKIADKICNVGDIDADSPAGWDRERKLEYLQWAERVVEGCRGVNPKLDSLFGQTVAAARRRIVG